MAGLSIMRRRKAWLKGVAYGAGGFGKCLLQVPKLRDIYQRGVAFGRANPDVPYVRGVLEQERRRTRPQSRGPQSHLSPRQRHPQHQQARPFRKERPGPPQRGRFW